jgi:hypothetical protein
VCALCSGVYRCAPPTGAALCACLTLRVSVVTLSTLDVAVLVDALGSGVYRCASRAGAASSALCRVCACSQHDCVGCSCAFYATVAAVGSTTIFSLLPLCAVDDCSVLMLVSLLHDFSSLLHRQQ